MIAGHELVGTRIVGQLPADDMVRLWIKVSSGIVKHGFVIPERPKCLTPPLAESS
jgi:hypothetical protein